LVKLSQQLTQRVVNPAKEPTIEWIADQLKQLAGVLSGGGPAAALALRDLVGGQIIVREIRQPGRKRFFAQGRFVIRAARVCRTLNVAVPDRENGGGLQENAQCEEIVIDFRDSSPLEKDSDRAKDLYDQGWLNCQIAAALGCARNWVTKLLNFWFEARGQPALYQHLADQAKIMWDEGMADVQIAERLNCSPPTVVAAVAYWHASRGLEVPNHDGRRTGLVERMELLYRQGSMIKDIAREVGMCSRSVTLLLRQRFESVGQPMPDGRTRRAALEQRPTKIEDQGRTPDQPPSNPLNAQL
jgi:hypothetical protein